MRDRRGPRHRLSYGERSIGGVLPPDLFAGIDLDYVLRARDVKTDIICGALTNFCCESIARTACFLNYHVVFGSDANAAANALACPESWNERAAISRRSPCPEQRRQEPNAAASSNAVIATLDTQRAVLLMHATSR